MFGKKPSPQKIPDDRVRLKPVLGVRPRVYVSGIYGLIILGILFFSFLFPGLRRPGSLIRLESEPWGAAVRIDDITLGATPCELFVPRGRRVIEFVLPGFQPLRIEADVPGRVFASSLLPSRLSFSETLSLVEALDALILGAADYAEWSFTGEPTAAYQIPLSLSEGVYRSAPAARAGLSGGETDALLEAAARFTVTRAALRDLLRSRFLADNGGLSPSPLSLAESAGGILDYLSRNPGSAAWLAELLPAETVAPLRESVWYVNTIAAAAGSNTTPASVSAMGRTVTVASLGFRELPSGDLLQAAPYPHRKTIPGFYIADTEISDAAWEVFLEARPQWKQENRAALIEEGLAGAEYPAPAIYPAYPESGVSDVSWYAARAYCEWLTGRLPPEFAAWEARLPSEAEWEYAARLIPAGAGAGFPVNMLGGLWEWCSDPYVPLNFLSADPDAVEKVSSPERSLRGGSWIQNPDNTPGLVTAETRASLPPDSSTPFVSFRPIIAPRRGTLQ
jgi:formylglycine-generating enzyme required for sulfatase activity